jgi:hypothetical protein
MKTDESGIRIYGAWAGNPKGHAEDKTRCIEEVWPRDSFMIPYQCHKKRGYGPDGKYCKQHAKKLAEKNTKEETPTKKKPTKSSKELTPIRREGYWNNTDNDYRVAYRRGYQDGRIAAGTEHITETVAIKSKLAACEAERDRLRNGLERIASLSLSLYEKYGERVIDAREVARAILDGDEVK